MKFKVVDKAKVLKSVYRQDFLKHILEEGAEVYIYEFYDGWKPNEAYRIMDGKISQEILLAEELEKINC